MKIVKRSVLWLSIMLVLELIINTAGAFIVKHAAADMMTSSMVGYSRKSGNMLHPTLIEDYDGVNKTNGLSGLTIRALLSDGYLYNHSKFMYNFLFLNFTMEQSVIFFDEEGTYPVSSGIFNVAYKDYGNKTDYIKSVLGIIDVKEFCKLDGAKAFYNELEKKQYSYVRLDKYSVDESFVLKPAKVTLLDEDKNELRSFEFPCDGDIVDGEGCCYIYDSINKDDDMKNSSTLLYKKMTDAYCGTIKTDSIAQELMKEADFTQSEQRDTKTSYGFACLTSKHVETTDGNAMTFALRFSYIKGVILYTIIFAVILTAILLPIWICKDRKNRSSYY